MIRFASAPVETPEFAGMGTTMVAATVLDDVAYVVNIGDSRLYRMSEDLRQITVDHSLVEEMVRSGEIRKDRDREHIRIKISSRGPWVRMRQSRPDCFEIQVRQGDVLLLCSDGLTNMLEDSEMEEILRENKSDLEQAGRTLVERANEAGGKDNISVILVRL